MIRNDIIERLPAELKQGVKTSIALIAASGVIDVQINDSFQAVLAGAQDEEPEKLAERIIAYRRETAPLIALKQTGEQLKEQGYA